MSRPVPGMVLEGFERRVTQDMIDAYADASGDRNPLHVDPAFAKTTPYGGTIAHGMFTFTLVSQAMASANWNGWANGGEIEVAFLGPVRPGDLVRVSAVVKEVEGSRAVCTVEARVDDRLVLGGTAISNWNIEGEENGKTA